MNKFEISLITETFAPYMFNLVLNIPMIVVQNARCMVSRSEIIVQFQVSFLYDLLSGVIQVAIRSQIGFRLLHIYKELLNVLNRQT